MIKLASPNISEEAIQKVGEVLRSGNLVQGQYVSEFESRIEEYLGVKHAIVVSSGTAALHLSLLALGIGKGDEVIVPAFTFPATVNVVEIVGAKPVFVDITLEDFCIDVSKIEDVITSHTKAIIPVHEFGMMADMDPIMEIADRYGLIVIEDAACALGSEYNKKKAGNFGTVGCFSFHPRKAITTGEGGALVTDDRNLAKKLRSLRNHGIDRVGGKIDFVLPGLNYRMTEVQAILGLFQLERLDLDIANRINLANKYNELLTDVELITSPNTIDNRKMVFQTYHTLIRDDINRDDLIEYFRVKNIESNYGAYVIPHLKYYQRNYQLDQNDYPNSYLSFNHGLALPLSNSLTNNLISYIVKTIRKFEAK